MADRFSQGRRALSSVGGVTGSAPSVRNVPIVGATKHIPSTFAISTGGRAGRAAEHVADRATAQQEKTQQIARGAKKKELAYAFREYLKTGLDGMVAYAEDLKQTYPYHPEISQKAEHMIQSLSHVFQSPKLDEKSALKLAETFYSGMEEFRKRTLDPELEQNRFKEIEDLKQKNRIALETKRQTGREALLKHRSDKNASVAREKFESKKKALGGIIEAYKRLDDPMNVPEVRRKISDFEDEIAGDEKRIAELEKKKPRWPRKIPLVANVVEKRQKLRETVAEKRKRLDEMKASPRSVLDELLGGLEGENVSKRIQSEKNKLRTQINKILVEQMGQAPLLETDLIDESLVEKLNPPGDMPIGAVSQKPQTPTGSLRTNADKLKILQDALNQPGADKQRIQAAIAKLQSLGVK